MPFKNEEVKKEYAKKYKKEYNLKNKEKIMEQKKLYRENNREDINEKTRIKRMENNFKRLLLKEENKETLTEIQVIHLNYFKSLHNYSKYPIILKEEEDPEPWKNSPELYSSIWNNYVKIIKT